LLLFEHWFAIAVTGGLLCLGLLIIYSPYNGSKGRKKQTNERKHLTKP